MASIVILHTGPHKTGTSALQGVLRANTTLLAGNGVLYPTAGMSNDSHALLAEALLRGDLSLLQDLAAEAHGHRVALISSEHLSSLQTPALVALRDSFPGAEFRVSYSLRRLAGLWPSHWIELVKHGQEISFAGYLDRVTQQDDRPFFAPVLPFRHLNRLAGVFGTEALRIALYDAQLAEGQDIGPAFIDDLLGLGHIAPAFATSRSNLRPSSFETALRWLVNAHAGSRTDHVTKQKAHRSLLESLHGNPPPPWHSALREAVARARHLDFGSDHPLVLAEQSGVVKAFGGLLPDGVDVYTDPMQTSVLVAESLQLSATGSAALSAAFDNALEASRSG